jgi:hypothetical protein
MAFVQGTVPFKLDGRKVYNIDYSVGQGQHNQKDDVMLVQELLRFIFYQTGYGPKKGFPILSDVPDIDVDGVCGNVTNRYIVYFKQCLRKVGHSVYPDAIILPFGPDMNQQSAVTRTFFTMAHLLNTARHADDDAQLKSLELLANQPDLPEVLRNSLKQVKPKAPGFRPGT